ncbi:MAG: hypothetical protein HZRFUVUK_001464 [Candidatus Fervidibacterota bacterium]|jgi:hypothetical protein
MAEDDDCASRLKTIVCFSCTLFLLQPLLCRAHERPPFTVDGTNERYEFVIPTVDEAPKVDGRIDEPIWATAACASGFRQVFPYLGEPASRETKVLALATKDALCFAFICAIGDKNKLHAYETRYDASMKRDERVTISLDTMHTHERTFDFTVNARGAKADSRFGNERWDGRWEAGVTVSDNEWVAEIVIPFSTLTYDPKVNSWGVNFWRYISETQELCAWAFHPDRPFDERYMPHLVGMPIPPDTKSTSNNLQLQTKLFATTKYDHEDGNMMSMYGLNGEWMMHTNTSLRFVLKPDFSEAEEAFESIDVSYVEQLLPDRREFFVQASEFFDEVSPELFYSRRIKRFDMGIKLTSILKGTSIGLLTTHGLKENEHNIALNIRSTPNPKTRLSFGYVGALRKGDHSHSIGVGGRIRFGNNGRFSFSCSYASHSSESNLSNGDAGEFRLHYSDRLWSASCEYSFVSPHFGPPLGYVPRRDFKLWSFHVSRNLIPKQSSFYRGGNLWARYNFGETFSGSFFNRSCAMGLRITLKDQTWIGIDYNRSKHAEYHIREQPFDDHSLNCWLSFGGNRPLRLGASYALGNAFDSRYRMHSLTLSWTKPDGTWNAFCKWSQRRHEPVGGTKLTVSSMELGLTRILSRDKWLSLRYFHRGGDYSVSNFAISFRIKRENGEELYLILGDPRASKLRRAFIVKWILPFTLGR